MRAQGGEVPRLLLIGSQQFTIAHTTDRRLDHDALSRQLELCVLPSLPGNAVSFQLKPLQAVDLAQS
jgi:hypothetical protein